MSATASAAPSHEAQAFDVAPNWKLVWWRFRKHRLAVLCAWLLAVIAAVGIAPDFFSTVDPNKTRATRSFVPVQGIHFFDEGSFRPHAYQARGMRNKTTLKMEWVLDAQRKIPVHFLVRGYEYKLFGLLTTDIHLFGSAKPGARNSISLLGTDRLGRDQWSRLMHGTQVSLSIGLVAVLLSIVIGIVLGGISGYYGGWIDLVIQRLIEILQSLPPIPIWMALTAALPRDWSVVQTYFAITVILSLIGWTTLRREVRGRFLSMREEDFVMSARLVGCSEMRVIFRHMLPTRTAEAARSW